MSHADLLIRPDLGRKAYRLRCAFTVPAFTVRPGASPTECVTRRNVYDEAVKRSAVKVAEKFVVDMGLQGWEIEEKHGFQISGPHTVTPIRSIPKRSRQEHWQLPAEKALSILYFGGKIPRLGPDPGYVTAVAPLNESEDWEYRIAAVFSRPTLVFEYDETQKDESA